MKIHKPALALLISIFFSGINAFSQASLVLPAGFKENAFTHVSDLAGFGIRNAGTKSEQLTLNYLLGFYKNLGLSPQTDTFNFEYFSADDILVFVQGKMIRYKTIYVDPYKNPKGVTGQSFCFKGDAKAIKQKADSIRNRIVFTTEPAEIYQLTRRAPLAIIIINDKELKSIHGKQTEIRIKGRVEKKTSYTVSCLLGPKKKKEILLGAHWDSFCGPGADDNASGVSVIMELSKFFMNFKDSLPYTIKVVFFGCEELGLLGSKAYTDKHVWDTASTMFYFNLDCVGDTGDIIADVITGQKGKCLVAPGGPLKSARDFKNSWSLLDPGNDDILYESKIPAWLDTALVETLNSTSHHFRKVRYCGSDHNSFANKGFITLHLGIDGNNQQHCPADNLKQVNKNSLELAGQVAAGLIIETMKEK
ncbi:MAG: M28 family peptidase [Bacteroidetes bacterium]|nr:M28 family peptidase [Bacteroidota bacterium]